MRTRRKMVRLCVSFFSAEFVRNVRKRTFDSMIAWQTYREYHNARMERVNNKNAVFIMREFQNACETIQTLRDETCVKMFLSRYMR